jgi:phosphoglycerate dehydrogenase-like enzyme
MLLLPERFRGRLAPLVGSAAWYPGVDTLAETAGEFDVVWAAGYMPAEAVERLLDRSKRLAWMHYSSTGVEHMPLPLLRERNVVLTNGAGLYAVPIAEHVVMCMLAARRNLPAVLRAQAARTWAPEAESDQELGGSTVLILGYGQLGRAVAQRLRPFGVEVFATRRSGPVVAEDGVKDAGDWRVRLGEADFVVATLPSTVETRDILGPQEISSMKPGAWLVNVARGSLVDESALLESLTSGHLGGAVLDAFRHEPLPSEHPFWGLENVILSPHSSWRSSRLAERDVSLFEENLLRFTENRTLRNIVNLEAGY